MTTDPVAALQRDVELLKERIKRPQVVVAPPGETQRPEPPNASPAGDPAPAPTRALTPAEVAEMLEVNHAAEPPDRAWSDKLRVELVAALDVQARTTVSSTQCATSLCKVALQHETVDAQRELASHVANLPALGAGVFYHYEDGADPPRTVLYIVREGHDMQELLAAR